MLHKRLRAAFALWLLAAALGLAATSARAQSSASVSGAESALSWRDGLRATLTVEGTPEVDFGDADVSWVRTTGRLALQGPVSERWGLGVSLSAELLQSDVDDRASFLAVAADDEGPLRDLFESTLSLGARRRIGERFALGADGYLSTKLEPGADLGDALKGGGFFTLLYRPSETFSFTAGVKLGSRFDRAGLFAWPVIRLEWQVTPRLEFEIQNANLRLAWAAWQRTELLLFGGAHTDRYRLERRASGPLSADAGTIGFRGANVGIGFRWNATEHLRVVGTAGVAVWQKLLIADASDDQIDSRELRGAAPVIALRLQARF
jgi:hypothetical protein